MRKVSLLATAIAVALTISILAGAATNANAATWTMSATAAASGLKSAMNKQFKFTNDNTRMTSARCLKQTATSFFCSANFSDGDQLEYDLKIHADGTWSANRR